MFMFCHYLPAFDTTIILNSTMGKQKTKEQSYPPLYLYGLMNWTDSLNQFFYKISPNLRPEKKMIVCYISG